MKVPTHLKKYIIVQDYSKYTPIDQAVWRFILRQLKTYLSKHAHKCYQDGLQKTGISVESIPKIKDMSKKLSKYGWKAVPVSGFIPPAIFMELQSLGILPIACDMRTVHHIMYTPAPDIVHEAAGHAPILIDPEFSKYLKSYAGIAKKAIIGKNDLKLYEAIRELSDLKESPHATPSEIAETTNKLNEISKNMGEPSEAALLARMNWWTAEYGLVGDINSPMIYGAGLLSSVGESKTSLKHDTKKIPFSLECLDFNYDITEPQPQLFVTPDFGTLSKVLEQFAASMAFKTGGIQGLNKIVQAETVNTVQLDSGVQISGKLTKFTRSSDKVCYLQFEGPTQICHNNQELKKQGIKKHPSGFGTAIGFLDGCSKSISDFSKSELKQAGITLRKKAILNFSSGVKVVGTIKSITTNKKKILLITFKKCTVTYDEKVLFRPKWGEYDMAIGTSVESVYAGPADRKAYGETQGFTALKVPPKSYSKSQKNLMALYSKVRQYRLKKRNSVKALKTIYEKLNKDHLNDWLLKLEIIEILNSKKLNPEWKSAIERDLQSLAQSSIEPGPSIAEGLRISGYLNI